MANKKDSIADQLSKETDRILAGAKTGQPNRADFPSAIGTLVAPGATPATQDQPAIVVTPSPNAAPATVVITPNPLPVTGPLTNTELVADFPLPVTIPDPAGVNLKQQNGVTLSSPIADAPTGNEVATIVRSIFRKKTTIETTTPLGAGATFTGAWHDSELDGTVFVQCESFANVVSASSLFLIQCSDDNTDSNFTYIAGGFSSTIPAGNLGRICVVIRARYWRVVYTNGASPQGSFKLTSTAMNFIPTMGERQTNVPAEAVAVFNNPIGSSVSNADNLNAMYYSQNNSPVKIALAKYGGAFSGTANTGLRFWSSARMATIFRQVSSAAIGSTIIWTPASGNKFRLLAFKLQITGDATLAVAGQLTIKLLDAAASLNLDHIEYIPAIAVNLFGGYDSGWISLGDFGLLSATANNKLNLNLSAALATGLVNIIVAGTEE